MSPGSAYSQFGHGARSRDCTMQRRRTGSAHRRSYWTDVPPCLFLRRLLCDRGYQGTKQAGSSHPAGAIRRSLIPPPADGRDSLPGAANIRCRRQFRKLSGRGASLKSRGPIVSSDGGGITAIRRWKQPEPGTVGVWAIWNTRDDVRCGRWLGEKTPDL